MTSARAPPRAPRGRVDPSARGPGAAARVLSTRRCAAAAGPASAAPTAPTDPTAPVAPVVPGAGDVDISVGDGTPSSSITLILAITVLSIAPSLLLLATSFTKIIVVLGLTRNALGLPTSPPNQVLTGIALFLTLFVMGPVFSDINDVAVQPYMDGTMTVSQAYDAGVVPLQDVPAQEHPQGRTQAHDRPVR